MHPSTVSHGHSAKSHPPKCVGHAVQFYDGEDFLYKSVNHFVHLGLEGGEGVIVIATQAHCDGIERSLKASGIDLARVRKRGQLTLLDAHETLSRFMVEGLPDEKRFMELISGLMDRVSESYPKIRAYGEMVNVLWSEGNQEATIALEELWNKLAKSRSFSLLCGYQIENFSRPTHKSAFKEVCKTHTRVMAAEQYASKDDPDDRQRYVAELQQQAIALKNEITEHKTTEHAFRKSQAELIRTKEAAKRATLAKAGFLARMNHAVRTPLSTILGFAELMLDSRGTEDKTECAQVILRNGRRIVKVLDEHLSAPDLETSLSKKS